eukprot:TRINITY_DN12567_c0_g1::TRINITY_DN12567_c0_g1_i1::g.2732::m.2732 TRINITY_DN12567_c0_g1::TRINITY_DN12567_c0_g1_i1::g.2732  ORF type:complete len:581 (+),score=41.37,MBD/PF01429.14/8.3e-05 TRINITY_DN12567_c0_g1_i1:145-1887(+)
MKRKSDSTPADDILPEGWRVEIKKSKALPRARTYRVFHGPDGKICRSRVEMMRYIDSAKSEALPVISELDRAIERVFRYTSCGINGTQSRLSLSPLKIPTPSTPNRTVSLVTSPRNPDGKLLGSDGKVTGLLCKTIASCIKDLGRLEDEFVEFELHRDEVFPQGTNDRDIYSVNDETRQRVEVLIERTDQEFLNLNCTIRRQIDVWWKTLLRCQELLSERKNDYNKILDKVDHELQQLQLGLSCLSENISEARKGLGKFGRSYEYETDACSNVVPVEFFSLNSSPLHTSPVSDCSSTSPSRCSKSGRTSPSGPSTPTILPVATSSFFFQKQRAAYCAVCALNHILGLQMFTYREAELLSDIFYAKALASPDCLTQFIPAPRLVSKRRDFPCDGFLAFEALSNLALLYGKHFIALNRKDPTELLDCIHSRLSDAEFEQRVQRIHPYHAPTSSSQTSSSSSSSSSSAPSAPSSSSTVFSSPSFIPVTIVHLGSAQHYVVLAVVKDESGRKVLAWLDSQEEGPITERTLQYGRRAGSRTVAVFSAIVEAIRENNLTELIRIMSPTGHAKASFFRVDDIDLALD